MSCAASPSATGPDRCRRTRSSPSEPSLHVIGAHIVFAHMTYAYSYSHSVEVEVDQGSFALPRI